MGCHMPTKVLTWHRLRRSREDKGEGERPLGLPVRIHAMTIILQKNLSRKKRGRIFPE
jgi:hypothetical protein